MGKKYGYSWKWMKINIDIGWKLIKKNMDIGWKWMKNIYGYWL